MRVACIEGDSPLRIFLLHWGEKTSGRLFFQKNPGEDYIGVLKKGLSPLQKKPVFFFSKKTRARFSC